MAAEDLLYLVVALFLGFALGAVAFLLFFRKPAEMPEPVRLPRGPPEPSAARPRTLTPTAPRQEQEWEDVEFAVVDEDAPARPPPVRAAPPRPASPDMEDSAVPTEWARRHLGALEPGRVKGICSGCGTPLSISTRRPLRVACPVCGRTRLLS